MKTTFVIFLIVTTLSVYGQKDTPPETGKYIRSAGTGLIALGVLETGIGLYLEKEGRKDLDSYNKTAIQKHSAGMALLATGGSLIIGGIILNVFGNKIAKNEKLTLSMSDDKIGFKFVLKL